MEKLTNFLKNDLKQYTINHTMPNARTGQYPKVEQPDWIHLIKQNNWVE